MVPPSVFILLVVNDTSAGLTVVYVRIVWLELFFPVACANIFLPIWAHCLNALFDSSISSFKANPTVPMSLAVLPGN